MQVPVQIVFDNVSHSEALESVILRKARKLETAHPRLMRCQISVEQPHRHQQQGNLFHVRLALHLPGDEIVVSHDAHEDVYVSLREAFGAAMRQLEDHARKTRSDLRQPAAVPAKVLVEVTAA